MRKLTLRHKRRMASFVVMLRDNKSVADCAVELGCSYRTACRWLRQYGFYPSGRPRHREHNEWTAQVWKFLLDGEISLKSAAEKFNYSEEGLRDDIRLLSLRVDWDIANHTDPVARRGRQAEELVKNVIFKGSIKKDSLRAKKTGSRTAPYDFIIRVLGAVDVKSTFLSGDTYKFTTRHSKQTKYLILVGFSSCKTFPEYAWLVPRAEADGAQSIRVPHPSTGRPHKGSLIWAAGVDVPYSVYSDVLHEELSSSEAIVRIMEVLSCQ